MSYNSNRYLILDPCGHYFVRIVIPVYLRPYFGGKRYFMRSTSTSDIKQARVFRDIVAMEFNKVREELRPKREGTRIEQILTDLRQVKQTAITTPIQIGLPVQTCPALRKMLDIYLLQFSDKRKLSTLSKTNKAVEVLLDFLNKRDIKLHDINRTTVTGWLDELKKDRAAQTMQNYISALAGIWDLARNRYHDAPQDNPWRGHGLEAKGSKISYEAFTAIELAKVYAALEDDEMRAVTLIGMYSGMRLNEICSLRPDNIREVEGVLCFDIKEGKTRSAARIVPVHSKLTSLVSELRQPSQSGFIFYRASLIDRADGKRSTWHTQRFTRAKRKALGLKGSERKVFHSLRHSFAQQLDRNKVPEDRIALLMGHDRGNTESFKTYSKGAASPVELVAYIELITYDLGV